uniref:Kelch domain-containing protein 4-like n=1 Tax=Diabrotica virgifera virgifera TaxID=50390 RepID=A0A6P7G8K9_DIAVI
MWFTCMPSAPKVLKSTAKTDDIESILLQIEKEEKKRLTVTEAIISPPSRRLNFTFMAHPEKEQLILYGGEFFNGQKTFVYGDLFFYNIPNNKWTVVKAPNGPPPRCGHQMVVSSANKGQLWVFGGEFTTPTQSQFYHYRDLWVFHLGNVSLLLSVIIIIKNTLKNISVSLLFSSFFLENDTAATVYKWSQVKIGGFSFSPRCGMPIISTANNLSAYSFGGVFDVEDDEEDLCGNFYNEFLQLELEKLSWRNVSLSGKKDRSAKSKQDKENVDEDVAEEKEVEDIKQKVETTTISDDGIFKVTVGGAPSTSEGEVINSKQSPSYFSPSPRMNCGLAIKHGVLYLYGGMYEEGSKQVTFSDFYSLDLKKLDEWKTIIADDTSSLEWLESDSEDEDVSDDNDDEEEDVDEDEDSDESEMEVD